MNLGFCLNHQGSRPGSDAVCNSCQRRAPLSTAWFSIPEPRQALLQMSHSTCDCLFLLLPRPSSAFRSLGYSPKTFPNVRKADFTKAGFTEGGCEDLVKSPNHTKIAVLFFPSAGSVSQWRDPRVSVVTSLRRVMLLQDLWEPWKRPAP